MSQSSTIAHLTEVVERTERRLKLDPSACLFLVLITVIPFTILTAMPFTVWDVETWGPVKNTRYCEPIQAHSAVREPVNSWSNFVYSLVGSWSFAAGLRDMRQAQVAGEPIAPISELRGNPAFSIVMGLSWLSLGMFSFLFHAANTRSWQLWDVGFTNNAAGCMAFWSACSLTLAHVPAARRRPRFTTAAYLASLLIVEACLVGLKWEYSTTICLSTLIGLVIFFECVVQPLLAKKSCAQRVLTATAILMILLAWIVRELEVNKGWFRPNAPPLCNPHSSWLNPHAAWHVGSGIAIACQLKAWRLSPPPPPLERRWHCCPSGSDDAPEMKAARPGSSSSSQA